MLATAMFRNISSDGRRETLTTANGVGIGFGGEAAYKSWLRGQDETTGPGPDAIARQEATLMRLRGMFAGTPGFANAIRKAN